MLHILHGIMSILPLELLLQSVSSFQILIVCFIIPNFDTVCFIIPNSDEFLDAKYIFNLLHMMHWIHSYHLFKSNIFLELTYWSVLYIYRCFNHFITGGIGFVFIILGCGSCILCLLRNHVNRILIVQVFLLTVGWCSCSCLYWWNCFSYTWRCWNGARFTYESCSDCCFCIQYHSQFCLYIRDKYWQGNQRPFC